MNTKNNRRHQATMHKIESVFLQLMQTKELSQITVSELCREAGINRTTFYANYLDVYDLANKLRDSLVAEVQALYAEERETQTNSNDFLRIFRHVYENQIFYHTYFKLGFDTEHQAFVYDTILAEKRFQGKYVDYHIEFFRHGLNAIIKKWLSGGCRETPEEMMEILTSEYTGKTYFL